MKILITGSAGFIFSNIVLYLLQHTTHKIVSVDKLTQDGSLMNISYNADVHNKRHKFYLADICDYDLMKKIFEMEKPDIVINAAAESNVDSSIKNASAFVMTNVVGTHSVLEASRTAYTPEKFIQFSTDEVFGQILEGSFSETDKLSPRNPYSATKASADLLCQSYMTTHNMPIIITRTCNAYGPRQKDKLIPTCIINLIHDKKIPVYDEGKQVREWIYVKDIFGALLLLIDKGIVGETYNIGSGEEIKNIDLVKKIVKIMGHQNSMIEFVSNRPGHDFRYALNSSKINKLGWEPKYKLDGAIEHSVNWYLKNAWFWREQ